MFGPRTNTFSPGTMFIVELGSLMLCGTIGNALSPVYTYTHSAHAHKSIYRLLLEITSALCRYLQLISYSESNPIGLS